MGQINRLFKRAESGDQQAKQAVQALGPSFANQPKKDPMETIRGKRELNVLASPVDSTLPEGTTGEKASPEEFDLSRGQSAAPLKPQRNWNTFFDALQVGLTDIGNAFGNPRAPVGGGGYEAAKQRLQADQMAQLERKHAMWDDAWKASQNLPQEVLMDPRFADLAQAKQVLDTDLMDGRVDNEKSVSGFLTALWAHKRELEQMESDVTNQREIDKQVAIQTGVRKGLTESRIYW